MEINLSNCFPASHDEKGRAYKSDCSIAGVTGGALSQTYTYTYNSSNGNVTQLDVTSGSISNKISYSYDGYGRITNKDIKTGSTSKVKQVYAYKTLSGTKTSLLVSNLTTYLSGAMSHAYAYTLRPCNQKIYKCGW